MFISADDPTPPPHQTLNPLMDIPYTQPTIPYPAGSPVGSIEYEYSTSFYAQNYLLAQDRAKFLLLDTIPADITRRLTRIALYGHNDIRVYASDAVGDDVVREFGTYDEIGEVVFDLVGVDFFTDEFIIGGSDPTLQNIDAALYFAENDVIRIADNTAAAPTEYVVGNIGAATNINRIPVRTSPGINPLTTVDGNISNITTPISPNGFTNSENVTIYVISVQLFANRPAGNNIRIIVGESASDEIGKGIVTERTYADNAKCAIYGNNAIRPRG